MRDAGPGDYGIFIGEFKAVLNAIFLFLFTVHSVAFLHEVVAAIVDQRAEVVTVARETCIARSTAVARTALPASAQDAH